MKHFDMRYVPKTNEENIRTFYQWLGHKPEELTEVRAIEYFPDRKGAVARDFVNNEDDFVAFCSRWNGERHVYAGLNPRKRKGGKTGDVARIVGIPFDIDPKRKKDAATDEEKNKAKANAEKFIEWLRSQAYQEPYVDDSGNGFHIIQKVNIPVKNPLWLENQLRNYHKEIQKAAPYMKLDSIFDMTRILKVPGTLSLKGENTLDRPHRTAKILTLGSQTPDLKLMKHIEEIKFQFNEPNTECLNNENTENWFLTDKRTRYLKPCQRHFLRKGGTIGKPDAERNEETGLRMNFVRSLKNLGFTKKEVLDIFRLFEDFIEEKSEMEINRIFSENCSKEWNCMAIKRNTGCLGRKCRHYLGNIEYADIDPERFVIFGKNHRIVGIDINCLVNSIQSLYMFVSTSAKSDIKVYNEVTGVWESDGEEVIKQTVKVWLGKYFRSQYALEAVKQIQYGCYLPNTFKDARNCPTR